MMFLFIFLYKSDSVLYKKTKVIQYHDSKKEGLLNYQAKHLNVENNQINEKQNKNEQFKNAKNISLINYVSIACAALIVALIIAGVTCCNKNKVENDIGIMTEPKL